VPADLQQHQSRDRQPDAALGPCIDTVIPVRHDDRRQQPSTIFSITDRRLRARDQHPGRSVGGLQLVQSRMMLPLSKPEDDGPNTRIQRQTMLLLPLISVAYGGFLPAGLFIYWITATIFSIIQQYLIVGWGGHVPAVRPNARVRDGHTPRFPVSMPPPPAPEKRAAILTDADKKTTADKTIRPRERGRQGRRGRRR
jgi:hypothetical protein